MWRLVQEPGSDVDSTLGERREALRVPSTYQRYRAGALSRFVIFCAGVGLAPARKCAKSAVAIEFPNPVQFL